MRGVALLDGGHVDLLALARVLVVPEHSLRRRVEVGAGCRLVRVLLSRASNPRTARAERGLKQICGRKTPCARRRAVGVQVPPVHRDVAVAGDELEQRLADGHVVEGVLLCNWCHSSIMPPLQSFACCTARISSRMRWPTSPRRRDRRGHRRRTTSRTDGSS